jgi:hypothetical protein
MGGTVYVFWLIFNKRQLLFTFDADPSKLMNYRVLRDDR